MSPNFSVWLIALIKLSSSAFTLYGEYKLYKNFGGVYYDYQGTGYHGYNGNQVLPDSQDTVQTDRGSYFDGTSTFVTIQDDDIFGGPDGVPEDIFIMVWAIPFSTGPFIHRKSVSFIKASNTLFKISFETGNNLSMESELLHSGTSVYSQETLTTSTGDINLSEFETDQWHLISGLFNCDVASNQSGLYLYVKDSNKGFNSYFTGSYSEDDGVSYKTLLGTDDSSYFEGFIFWFAWGTNSIDFEYARQHLNFGGCLADTCYFGSDSTYCGCEYCEKIENTDCLSTCADPYKDSECSLCTGHSCDSSLGCDTTGTCYTCGVNKWPTCEPDGTSLQSSICHSDCTACYGPSNTECLCEDDEDFSEIPCINCHSDCETCSGNTDSDCETCSSSDASLSGTAPNSCECDDEFYPSGSDPLVCSPCLVECATCSDGSSCDTCKVVNAVLEDGSCVCPNNSEESGGSCECSVGFTDVDPSSALDCQSSSDCIEQYSVYNSNTSECECPENSSIENLECVCEEGFFMKESNGNYLCEECSLECLTCETTSNYCLQCSVKYAYLENGSCLCPENSEITDDQCRCESGFFSSCENCSSFVCEECHEDCKECTGSLETECTECVDYGYLSTTRLCEWCEEGEYYEEEEQRCEECSEQCVTCFGFSDCLECRGSNVLLNGSTCVCEEGYFMENNRCRSCYELCSACNENECSSCIENASLFEDTCVCDIDYEKSTEKCELIKVHWDLEIDAENRLIVTFRDTLNESVSSEQIEISIEDGIEFKWEIMESTENSLMIEMTFYEFVETGTEIYLTLSEEIVSVLGAELSTYKKEGELNEFIYEDENTLLKNITKRSIEIVSISVLITSFLNGNPTSFWCLVNTIQLLTFLPLSGIPITEKLRVFFLALTNLNPIPNFFTTYLTYEEEHEKTYEEAYNYGYESASFYKNCGSLLTILCFLVLLFFCTFVCSRLRIRKFSEWMKKYLENFYLGCFLRFWIEAYLEIGAVSFIQILYLNFSSILLSIESIVAIIFFVIFTEILFLISPIFIVILIKNFITRVLNEEDSLFHKIWSSLYYEFKKNTVSKEYYSVFTIRRALYMFNLVLANEYIYYEACFNILLEFLVFIYVIMFKPFNILQHQFLNSFFEGFLLIIFALVSIFTYDISESTELGLEWSIIILTIIIILVSIGFSIYFTFKSLRKIIILIKNRKNIKSEEEVTEIDTTVLFKFNERTNADRFNTRKIVLE